MIKLRFFISPYFLLHRYLLRDIKYVLDKYNFKGKVLDVGCGQKPYNNLFDRTEYLGIDFENYSRNKEYFGEKPDIYFPSNYKNTLTLPFKNNFFDNVVSFQVLEHHRQPDKMIREIVRVCKPKGLILLSSPLIWGLHEEPSDYYRYTEYGIIEFLKRNKCTILEIKKQGSIFSTISLLLNQFLTNFAMSNKINYVLACLIFLPFLIFSYSCILFDVVFTSKKIYFNVVILAIKNKKI